MTRYRTTVNVPTPLEDTFDYLARFDTTAEWDPGVEEARMITSGPVTTGSAFTVVSRFLGRRVPMRYEVTDIERPRKVVLRATNRWVESIDTITFAPADGGGTSVTYDADLRPRGIARLADPLLALAFRRIGDRAVAGLVRSLEDRARDHAR